MKHCTTRQGLNPQNILPMLQELDSLYYECPLAAYERRLQAVAQQVEHNFPGFTIAHAEIYTAGQERNPHGGMRHVLLPTERNVQ